MNSALTVTPHSIRLGLGYYLGREVASSDLGSFIGHTSVFRYIFAVYLATQLSQPM
jgi:hypothetical protein